MSDHLDIEVTPADQRIAAEIAEALVHCDGETYGERLAALAGAGLERTLVVAAVLSRCLAATLIASYGRDGALRVLESTRLDAALADDDDQPAAGV